MKTNIQIILETTTQGRLDITERTNSFRSSTIEPGGFYQAQGDILASERDLLRLIDEDSNAILTLALGDDEIWTGTLQGYALTGEKLTIKAEGKMQRLRDSEVWRILADSQYARWQPQDADKFDKDNNARVYIAPRQGTAYAVGDEGKVIYPKLNTNPGADRFVRIQAHVEMFGWGSDWLYSLKADGATIWSEIFGVTGNDVSGIKIVGIEGRADLASEFVEIENVESNLIHIPSMDIEDETGIVYTVTSYDFPGNSKVKIWTKAGSNTATDLYMNRTAAVWRASSGQAALRASSGQGIDLTVFARYKWLDIDETFPAAQAIELNLHANVAGEGAAIFKLTQVCVQSMKPCTNDAIIREILSATDIRATAIGAAGIEVLQAAYEGTNRLDVIREMAKLGDGSVAWQFVIYDSEASFKAWPSAPDWLLLRKDMTGGGIDRDRTNVINAVRARMPDGWLSAWQEDATSIAQYGRREKTISVQATSQADAIQQAQLSLLDKANQLTSVRIEAGTMVRKPDNTLWPAALIRAGDVIALRDLFPNQDLLIRVAETQFNGATLTITPVGASSRLEMLLARRKISG